MTSKLRTLCIAFIAVLAIGAMTAAAAQAGKFMTEGNVSATIRGEQVGTSTFTVEGNKVSCETAKVESAKALSSPAESWTVHPTYAGCTAFGFVGATVTTTGCDYTAKAGESIGEGEFSGTVELNCEAGKSITIIASTCEATVSGPQSFTTGVTGTFSKKPSIWHILTHLLFGKVKVKKVKDGFLCPLNGTGETTGEAAGTTTWWAWLFGEEKEVGVTFEP
jgi:hypothetical protein